MSKVKNLRAFELLGLYLNRGFVRNRLIRVFSLIPVLVAYGTVFSQENSPLVLTTDTLQKYVGRFNSDDEELYSNAIPNKDAFGFLKNNIPLFECPDKNFERIYYFRWWVYRKHIKQTPEGYVITEFLPKVDWSGKYNTISCPGTHHFREGRWLHDPKYLQEYATFWTQNDEVHKYWNVKCVQGYAFPLPDALTQFHMVHPCRRLLLDLLDEMIINFEELKAARKTDTGLYWGNSRGWKGDGMEYAIGGNGIRPTVNSCMYAHARSLAIMAKMKGDIALANQYNREAEVIAAKMLEMLWDDQAKFFKVMRYNDIPEKDLAKSLLVSEASKTPDRKLVYVRELHGYIPWYYSIPHKGKGYEQAWEQLMDPEGFYAPYGPTSAEQRSPDFAISYEGHECKWNGPSWPYETCRVLTAMANVLNNYPQDVITPRDYYHLLAIYTMSHQFETEDGRIVPWIDEDLNPYTGDWISRTRLKTWKNGTWASGKGGKERGKDYNHSTYNDLIITGLVGLKPRMDEVVEINPLLPPGTWDFFCLDNVLYHNHYLTILWDKTGKRYNKGVGLKLFIDGREVASSKTLSKITGSLN